MFWMHLFFGSFSFLLVRLGSVSARLGFYTLPFEISAPTAAALFVALLWRWRRSKPKVGAI
jgi:hypothetical protein